MGWTSGFPETREPLVLYRSPECWGYAELEQTWKYNRTQCFIICHRYRSIRKQSWPCHKNGQGHLLKKAPGHGHTTSIFKLLLFPSFCTISRKIPFALYIIWYDILFYFIHVYIAPGQEEITLGDNFLWKQKGLITLITGCMFQKIALSSDFMHTFSWFYTCI